MAEAQALTNEELAALIKNGESGLLPDLWIQVRRYILKQTRKYIPNDGSNIIEQGDFEDAGYMAMVEAVEKFKPDAGLSFIGYLKFYLSKYFKEVRGWSLKHPDPILSATSLDKPLSYEDESFSLADTIADDGALNDFEDLDDRLTSRQQAAVVLSEMDKLEPQQADTIRAHYLEGKTLDNLAANAGLSRERIRQIEASGITKLRRMKKIREIARERITIHFVDINTDFYKQKGASAFQSTGSSVVEDIVERRESIEKKYHERLDAIMKEHGADFYEKFKGLDVWYQSEVHKFYRC